MDRPIKQIKHRETVRTCRSQSIDRVLRGGPGDAAEFECHAKYRRAIFENAFLWVSKNVRLAQCARLRRQPKASSAAHADDGDRGNLSQAKDFSFRQTEREVPVFTQGAGNCSARSSLGYRHYIHTNATWLLVLGGRHRLVQSVRVVVGVVEQPRYFFLHSSAGKGVTPREAGDFQQRSRQSIYESRFHGPSEARGHSNQHGWQGPRVGQHHGGALVAKRQIRRSLHQGLHRSVRCASRARQLFSFLQQRTSASVAQLPDPKTSPLQDMTRCGFVDNAANAGIVTPRPFIALPTSPTSTTMKEKETTKNDNETFSQITSIFV